MRLARPGKARAEAWHLDLAQIRLGVCRKSWPPAASGCMRMIDADHFENDVTVEDPEYLTGPWKWKWIYQRRPDYKMYEYVCEENREFADPETGAQRMKVGPPPKN